MCDEKEERKRRSRQGMVLSVCGWAGRGVKSRGIHDHLSSTREPVYFYGEGQRGYRICRV